MATQTDIDKIKKDATEGVDEIISGITLDDIRNEAITIRIGGRLVNLEVAKDQPTDEDVVRKELTDKFNQKLQAIRGFVNEKAMEIENVISTYRNDYEKKERELEKRLAGSNLMPEINRTHSYKGLSVVKGGGAAYDNRPDIYTWIYRTTYKPTRYNGEPLDPKFAKKMITPIIIELTTEGKKILGIRVKKYIGDSDFEHYHGGCWGDWRYNSEEVKTPDDALRVCENASSILDNINGRSLAHSNPRGLPRNSTLQKNIVRSNTGASKVESNRRSDERTGLNDDAPTADSVWST